MPNKFGEESQYRNGTECGDDLYDGRGTEPCVAIPLLRGIHVRIVTMQFFRLKHESVGLLVFLLEAYVSAESSVKCC